MCKYKGVEIIEGHMMLDHVHLLLSIPPKISVSSFMGYLKGKSALMVFERKSPLDDYIKTGTALDAGIQSELLKNLFFQI